MPSDMEGLEQRAQDLEHAIEALQAGEKTREVRTMLVRLTKLKRETMKEMVRKYLTTLSEQKAFGF